jgi:hypothetical protein
MTMKIKLQLLSESQAASISSENANTAKLLSKRSMASAQFQTAKNFKKLKPKLIFRTAALLADTLSK